jgi:hypothetical protein
MSTAERFRVLYVGIDLKLRLHPTEFATEDEAVEYLNVVVIGEGLVVRTFMGTVLPVWAELEQGSVDYDLPAVTDKAMAPKQGERQ